MSRQVSFGTNEMTIKFTGLTGIAGLRGKLDIPYSAIKNVQAGNFKLHWTALRIGGTSVPFGYKAGNFRYKGETYFLSYSDPNHVIVIDLEGYKYDKVVVQVGNPKQMKQAILKYRPDLKEAK